MGMENRYLKDSPRGGFIWTTHGGQKPLSPFDAHREAQEILEARSSNRHSYDLFINAVFACAFGVLGYVTFF